MKLTAQQRAIAEALFVSDDAPLAQLVKIAKLNPAIDLMGADFRCVDFSGDDLDAYNFSGADMRGANLSAAKNVGRAMFAGALTDGVRWPQTLGPLFPGSIVHDHPDAPPMVVIPPGRFLMGIPETETKTQVVGGWDEHARPQHEVRIPRPFLLGSFPVTVGEFATFVEAEHRDMGNEAYTWERDDHQGALFFGPHKDRDWRNPGFVQTDAHPVVCVSHNDALAYADWLSKRTRHRYRLPSEAEWEYAARAGTVTARWWGDDWDPERANYNDEHTTPMGDYPPNPWGLNDMLGNVWEWCADVWHDNYKRAPKDGSAWNGKQSQPVVLRGGTFINVMHGLRAGFRNNGGRSFRGSWFGFRLARTL